MSEKTKIWLIIAASLVVLGLIMFAVVMSAYNWDFTRLSTEKYKTNTYYITQAFNNIAMNTDTADILFAMSDDKTCKVVCHEQEKINYSVGVADGTLTINVVDNRAWYEYIGINFDKSKITVYLPEIEYNSLFIKESTGDIVIPKDFEFSDVDISLSTGDVKFLANTSELVKIKTSTGNICVENASAGAIELSVSTGEVTVSGVDCEGDVKIKVSTGRTNLTDTKCKNVISSGSTGNINLKNVIASQQFLIKRSTGDVRFDGSDAAEILVQTDTGHVKGTLLTNKVFIAQTDTGSVNVPNTVDGGKCEISTDTGDIKISIKE